MTNHGPFDAAIECLKRADEDAYVEDYGSAIAVLEAAAKMRERVHDECLELMFYERDDGFFCADRDRDQWMREAYREIHDVINAALFSALPDATKGGGK